MIELDAIAGAPFSLGTWSVTEEAVQQYLAAVGDDAELYRDVGLAPPLALCAYALSAILDRLSLPAGTIHSIQEMAVVSTVALGQEIHGEALPERPRQRGGLQFMTIGYTLSATAGNPVQTGKTTVLLPKAEKAENYA